MVQATGFEPAKPKVPDLQSGAANRICLTCIENVPRYLYSAPGAIHFKWPSKRELNPRPSGPKPDALPDCAIARKWSLGYRYVSSKPHPVS